MNTPVTESELQEHSTAPRITEKNLDENIICVNYLNIGEALTADGQPAHQSHHLLTLCILVLKNGFTIVGESACASPENYDAEIGRRLAYADAKKKVWPLMGYALRDHLIYGGQSYWAQPAKEHVFWRPGEDDCPRDIKAPNGELHTLRCKLCGADYPRGKHCEGV